MKTVGIFAAKTHFPALCEQVASSRTPIMVSKRGRPLVVIEPVREELISARPDIHSAWQTWKADNPEVPGDFPDVWNQRGSAKDNPLAD